MTDQATIARLLVLQKAFLDVLKDADAETREEANALFDVNDAKGVRVDGSDLGRVRRDKPRQEWFVEDWAKYEAWARQTIPEHCQSVAPWVLQQIKKGGGVVINKATGEILEPEGVGLRDADSGRLVVTVTDAAMEWARQVVGLQLKELGDGPMAPPEDEGWVALADWVKSQPL